jgi:hypothetical protein
MQRLRVAITDPPEKIKKAHVCAHICAHTCLIIMFNYLTVTLPRFVCHVYLLNLAETPKPQLLHSFLVA